MRAVAGILFFGLTLAFWLWLMEQQLGLFIRLIVIVGGVLAVLPVVWIGRALLDAQPTLERAMWVTTIVHYVMMVLIGGALIEATKGGLESPGWVIPLPPEVGVALMAVSGAVALVTMANLALRGLGAPFAIVLSRRLALDWLYAWTRNPMVLSALAFLLALGLWQRSTLFVLWVVAVVTPVMLAFLKVFEERELEIRFGAAYLEYKAKTPMLWPKRPVKRD